MRQRPASRALLLVGAAAAVGLLGGCAAEPGAPAATDGSAQGGALPRPEVGGYAPLTVWLTVPAAEAVPGSTGRPYGCDDLLVPVQTVPADVPDDADAALDFLFSDERGWHGDPSLWNAVFETRESLTPTGHRLEGDVDVFTFTGTVTAEGECEAERIRAQLQETAAAHTSAGQVRLEVDGRPLDDVLGLAPLALGDEVDVPESGAAPSESPTDPAEEPWEEPAEDPWAEPTEDTWSEPSEDPWAEAEEPAEPSPTAWEEPAEETWEPQNETAPTEEDAPTEWDGTADDGSASEDVPAEVEEPPAQDEGVDPADESAPVEDAGADAAGDLGAEEPDAAEPSAP